MMKRCSCDDDLPAESRAANQQAPFQELKVATVVLEHQNLIS